MGKKIDYFVLTAGITAALYIYIRGAIQNRTIALVLAMVGCMLIRRLFRRISALINGSTRMKRRKMRRQCGSAMMYLACMDSEEAADRLHNLIENIYGIGYEIEMIQCHPSATVGENDIFAIWKRHRSKDKLVICTTGHIEAACRSAIAELKQPRIALIDATVLSQLITEHPEGMFQPEAGNCRRQVKLHRFRDAIINRRNAPRCLVTALSMLVLYLFSANVFYLAASLFLLFIGSASLKQQRRPAKLF